MLEEKLAALLLRFASSRLCFSPQRLPLRYFAVWLLVFPLKADIGDHVRSHSYIGSIPDGSRSSPLRPYLHVSKVPVFDFWQFWQFRRFWQSSDRCHHCSTAVSVVLSDPR